MLKRQSIRIIGAIMTASSCLSVLADELPFATATVAERELARERLLEGIVEAVNESTVSAQTTGRITEVNYDVGDFVPKDAVIVRMLDAEQREQVVRMEADAAAAEARYAEARSSFKRAQDLHVNKNISKSALDSASADLDTAKAFLQAARAALQQARQQLGYTVVRAPYSGIVTRRHVQIGELAAPGQALMTGLSLEYLRIRVDVPQQLIYGIRSNRSARVIHPKAGIDPISTQAITVFPYANEASHTFRVRVALPEQVTDLFPGMLVKVAFTLGVRNTLVIPNAAMLYRSEVAAVYVVGDEGRVALRQVRPGAEIGAGELEILAGLEPGERIALDPLRAGVYMKETAISSPQ
ncbi:MAG: efflux RND transporter periplasmic adaptor subunit [Gammaproteobacteria bacterium]|nr:efflux RND transporter periplasmic adaptor subunit [Gammaproteobacteria bacterium]